MRNSLKLALLAALGMAAGAASPAHAVNDGVWDHNGSKMTLEINGEKRKLVYSEPREGLDKAGIKPGTVLFNGERKANGRFAGFAKIFKATCNPIDYFVEGAFDEKKGEIILQGQAPVYAGQGCEVSGYADDSPASRLVFNRIGDAPASAVVAETQPEPEIEQGDRRPDDDYLPPSQRGNREARTEPEASPAPRRAEPEAAPAPRRERPSVQPRKEREAAKPRRERRNDPADIDESDPEPRYYRPRERRYGRAPDPYEQRAYPYRRRPGIWEPEDEFEEDDEDYEYERPSPPFWRRGPY